MDTKTNITLYPTTDPIAYPITECAIFYGKEIIGLVSSQDFMDGKSLSIKLNKKQNTFKTKIYAYQMAEELIGINNQDCQHFYILENTLEFERVFKTLGWQKDGSLEEELLKEGHDFGYLYKMENPYYNPERKAGR